MNPDQTALTFNIGHKSTQADEIADDNCRELREKD